VLVSGGDLTDAQPGFDQRTSQPIVSFRFNSTSGARKFARPPPKMSASLSPSCSTTR
jgi:preprotein translocase subunit SecD